VRTTYGSRIYADHVPEADAVAVRRARQAGAIVVGKTLTHEFAWGITRDNPHFPPCRNPWDPERIPGGSSGGSGVALATGQAALALGSDTAVDPHPRRVLRRLRPQAHVQPDPRHRRLPAGPLARPRRSDGATPADLRLFYEALTGSTAAEVREPRIAVCPTCICARWTPPSSAPSTAPSARSRSRSSCPSRRPTGSIRVRLDPERRGRAGPRRPLPGRKDEYSPDVAARLERARTVPLEAYVEATATRERIRAGFARLFTSADLLLTPIHSLPPEPRGVGAQSFRDGVLPFTVPQDLAGLPSAAVHVASTTSACRSACSSPARPGAKAACSPPPRSCSARQHRRGRDPRRSRDLRDPHPDLVLEAPAPVLAGFERADDRMP
jgi:aspartyl-tRNA(Asn)/glutamyl-tRNA(Gln) amidotransferase subunit A